MTTVAVTGDGRHGIIGCWGGLVLWDLAHGQAVAFWKPDDHVWALGWRDQHSTIIAGDSGGGVHILRLLLLRPHGTASPTSDPVHDLRMRGADLGTSVPSMAQLRWQEPAGGSNSW